MTTQHTSHSKAWRALTGISLASFLGCLDFTIVNTALPAIQANLHATVTQLQWIINIFMLALSALMVVMGKIADVYGRRRILYGGMILFGIASCGAGLSTTIDGLIFFRLIQGIGVAILYTVPVAIIATLFPEHLRGKATGILIGANGFGLAVGPVIGGFIISALSWRWIFFVNLPAIILSFIFCMNTLTESRSVEHGKKIDWTGFLLLVIALPCVVFATVQGSHWGWTSGLIISLYSVAIISFITFYFVENRAESPIIQFKLFANRIFIVGTLANFLLAFFYTVAFFLIPLYLHSIQGETSYEIGLTLLPATAMVAILSPLVGQAIDKYGYTKVLMLGFGFLAGSALMQTYFVLHTPVWFILLAFIMLGIGWACVLSPSIVAALSSFPESMGGVAMGSVGTLHNFGGAIGLALGTVVYHYQAKSVVISELFKNQLNGASGWIDRAIGDPENAIHIIQQSTNLDVIKANELFQHFFIYGYSSAMWLLVASSIAALVIIFAWMK